MSIQLMKITEVYILRGLSNQDLIVGSKYYYSGSNIIIAGSNIIIAGSNIIITGSVAASTPTMVSTSVTNTRQLGVKKTIELTKKGTFGFGLSSRDVATNTDDIPIYIKSITAGGAAFHDGRLKIGDRILEVPYEYY